MRNPRDFAKPLAIGAPAPVLEIPFRPSRMIHFLDFSNEKMVAKVPDIAPTVDILLGNLEDAVPVDRKEAARQGLITVGKDIELGETQLWTRVNSLESPWVLDDLTQVVTEIGHRLDVIMIPKVEGPWHYAIARMVDACTSNGILPFYGPFGDIGDDLGCETQFRSAFLLGCVGAWSLHPKQIAIAKKVFSPDPEEVAFAKKVIEAIPDGRGVHMIDGKMQDDATWKQRRLMVDLAEMLAKKDPELAEAYGLQPA